MPDTYLPAVAVTAVTPLTGRSLSVNLSLPLESTSTLEMYLPLVKLTALLVPLMPTSAPVRFCSTTTKFSSIVSMAAAVESEAEEGSV